MDSKPARYLVAFVAPAVKDGKKGRIFTSYELDGVKARALEETVEFVGVCVDSGTFEETSE